MVIFEGNPEADDASVSLCVKHPPLNLSVTDELRQSLGIDIDKTARTFPTSERHEQSITSPKMQLHLETVVL